jgi:hypothetical protein
MTKSKISKKPSKHVRKRNTTRTRQAVEKLDASLENVLVLMQVHQPQKNKSVLDSKQMKEALRSDEEQKDRKKRAEAELASQLEMITGMDLGKK